tara:strand:+ start:1337 stop:2050 length:714 start_codon:yes stop_codon:yes gene_type:complete
MNFIFALFLILPTGAGSDAKPDYKNLSHKGTPDIGSFVKPIRLSDGSDKNFVKTGKNSPVTYDELIDEAVFNCPNVRNVTKVNEALLWKLVAIEKKYNPPPSLRGMLLAAACMESGYNPQARGDRKFSKKRKPKAVGILQFWPWAEKYIDRENPTESADFWMKRIKRQLKKSVKKNCSFKSEKRKWLAAWVTAVRAPKKGGRCYEKVKHYRLLKKWHKSIEKYRKRVKISGYDGCGC